MVFVGLYIYILYNPDIMHEGRHETSKYSITTSRECISYPIVMSDRHYLVIMI